MTQLYIFSSLCTLPGHPFGPQHSSIFSPFCIVSLDSQHNCIWIIFCILYSYSVCINCCSNPHRPSSPFLTSLNAFVSQIFYSFLKFFITNKKILKIVFFPLVSTFFKFQTCSLTFSINSFCVS